MMTAEARKMTPHVDDSGAYAVGKLILVNPDEREIWPNRYVLQFGAYGGTLLLAYGDCLESALDECVDWLEEHAPGLLCSHEQMAEAYAEAKRDNPDATDDQLHDLATVDLTCAGNHSRYLPSWEWMIAAENPTRETLRRIANA